MILLIDNYDSFVYNLARYVRELGEETVVRRHDATSHEEIERLGPSHIIISPGPCSPGEAGISTDVVRRFGSTIPILGVCLGHQCIGAAYGAGIVRAGRPMHGKASRIRHDGSGLFAGLPNPFAAARYHSLVISRSGRSEEHTSELQSLAYLVCRLLLEKKKRELLYLSARSICSNPKGRPHGTVCK